MNFITFLCNNLNKLVLTVNGYVNALRWKRTKTAVQNVNVKTLPIFENQITESPTTCDWCFSHGNWWKP